MTGRALPRNPLIGGFGANPTQAHLLCALRRTSPRSIPSQ